MSEMNFVAKRDNTNIALIKNNLAQLPHFCNQFFLGISQTTTTLTRLNYSYDLIVFFNFLTTEVENFVGLKNSQIELALLNTVTPLHLELFSSYLQSYTMGGKQYSNHEKAIERKLCTLRSFFKYFFKKALISANVATNVDLPKKHAKEIVRLSQSEVQNMISAIETKASLSSGQQKYFDSVSVRDNAIVTLLLGTGIRISECVGINVENLNFETGSFKVVRKGGSEAILYFGDEVAVALKKYLHFREIETSTESLNRSKGPLFLSLQNKRISVRAVQKMVKKYSVIAAPLKKISPHKLRSTYGTNLYRQTKDIYIVADVLGHKDVNTTKKHYAAISEDIRKSVANKVKIKESNTEE